MIRSLLLVVLSALAATVLAWSPFGHRQIADLAWVRLTPKAKRQVAAILLAGDPLFRPFPPAGDITDVYLEKEVRPMFWEAAHWPDHIKGNASPQYDALIDRLNRESPGVRPAEGKEELRCKTWHYFDTALFDPGSHQARPSNALRAMELARGSLEREQAQPNPDRREQCFWLYWIAHVTGDLHQPLHCAESFKGFPNGDAGGNLFMIAVDPRVPGNTTRLHGYWDDGVASAVRADTRLSGSTPPDRITAVWMADAGDQPAPASYRDLSVASWIREGAGLALTHIYGSLSPGGTPDAEYRKRMLVLCKRQALLAGYRLAEYLNKALG